MLKWNDCLDFVDVLLPTICNESIDECVYVVLCTNDWVVLEPFNLCPYQMCEVPNRSKGRKKQAFVLGVTLHRMTFLAGLTLQLSAAMLFYYFAAIKSWTAWGGIILSNLRSNFSLRYCSFCDRSFLQNSVLSFFVH